MFYLSNSFTGDNRGRTPFWEFVDDFFDFDKDALSGVFQNFEAVLKELPDKLIIKADLPNVDPTKINLQLTPSGLIISAIISEKKTIKVNHLVRQSRIYGPIIRSIRFDVKKINLSDAKAHYKNGVLIVELPKKNQYTMQVREIPINA